MIKLARLKELEAQRCKFLKLENVLNLAEFSIKTRRVLDYAKVSQKLATGSFFFFHPISIESNNPIIQCDPTNLVMLA